MITSVITGDIIKSRQQANPEVWIKVLKAALSTLEPDTKYWEVFRGDSFQIEIRDIYKSFESALYIKACIKMLKDLDVRLAIGIGEKTYEGNDVTESNGEAFVFSGVTLEMLKKEKVNLKIKTSNEILNQDLNVSFKLALIAMDNWTINSAEIVKLHLENQHKIQEQLAEMIGINQNAVSKRMKRANLDDILEFNHLYRQKIATL